MRFTVDVKSLANLQRNLARTEDKWTMIELHDMMLGLAKKTIIPTAEKAIRRSPHPPHIRDTARVSFSKGKRSVMTLRVGNKRLFYGDIIDARWFRWKTIVVITAVPVFFRTVDHWLSEKVLRRLTKGG